eukprot:CAMPEP_0119490610 /NCGR_PEP_ID=MMETSP1344-20130328/15742_1 /TAXON_ID=236787 /ORGANISM="Florenciella parvula, Strain CCMP2471" /LENGTH=123 /DNA_ID=CAMNT_0007525791 /DNA_START=27 /DNA_END=394 /DNA_ORIENTATION=+
MPAIKRRLVIPNAKISAARRSKTSASVLGALSLSGSAAGLAPPGPLLLDLSAEFELVKATLLRRPSERNRSPYVGDIQLESGRVAIAHLPSLEMGGKCVPGAELLLKVATDKKGNPVGAEAVS